MNILVFVFLLNAQNEIVAGNAIAVVSSNMACEARASAWFDEAGKPPEGTERRYICVEAIKAHE